MRIFLIDDDEAFLDILKKTLQQASYEVLTAQDTKSAREIFSKQNFDAVISDIRFQGSESGLDLLAYFKKTKPVPVVLMTGFSDLIEAIEAGQHGADGFLAKPFKKEDLFKVLDSFSRGLQEVELADSNFCKLPIGDFVSGKDILYDIFIRLKEGKYVKIAHQGENISPDRIQSYKQKGLFYLFLKKDDFKKYIGLNLKLLEKITPDSKVDRAKKFRFLKHTSDLILERIFQTGIDKESFEQAKSTVENTVFLLSESDEAFNLLESLNTHSDSLFAHSLGVSLYSALIVEEMPWKTPVIRFKVSVGGLLHDVGKKEISKIVLDKPITEYTSEERAQYEAHPQAGLELLHQLPGITGDILQIVSQHHENCVGLGFPHKLRKQRIHPLAKVVALANDFCNLTIKNPNSKRLSPHEALQKMCETADYYEEAAFAALMVVFKFRPV